MIGWAVGFLVVALVAAMLGFSGVAGTASVIAKMIFVIFTIAFVLSLIVAPEPSRAAPAARSAPDWQKDGPVYFREFITPSGGRCVVVSGRENVECEWGQP